MKAPGFFSTCLNLLPAAWSILVHHWPGTLGNRLRYRYYQRRLKHLGQGVTLQVGIHIVNPQFVSIDDRTCIDRYVTILAGPANAERRKVNFKTNDSFQGAVGDVTLGKRIHVSPFAYLVGHGGLQIGDDSGVGSGARVFSVSHHYRNVDDETDHLAYAFTSYAALEDQALISGPVVIGEKCAVGLNSVVLPGTTIGDRTWVGTTSTAMGTLPPDCVAVGNPAVAQPIQGRATSEDTH